MDEDFLSAVGGFDEAESAAIVPGLEGSGEVHGEKDLRSLKLELSVALNAKTRGDSLSAAVTVLWVTTLVPNNQNAKRELFVPIDDRVREVGQRVDSATICCRCSEARMLLEQLRYSFKLIKKSPSQSDPCFFFVEALPLQGLPRQTGGCTDSLNFRAQSCEHIVQLKQHRRIAVSFRVSSGSYGIPGCVTGRICVQAGDDSVEHTDAVGFR